MLCLTARCGDQSVRIPVAEGASILGAAADCDVVLPWKGVSRRHARLRRSGPHVVLEDLGSKNGVVLNGARVSVVQLAPGITVRLGEVALSLEERDTGDLEVAIDLPRGRSRRRERATDSVAGDVHGRGGAEAALGLVRRLELARAAGALEPDEVLRSVRELVGAETVVLAAPASGGGLGVTLISGPLPASLPLEPADARGAPFRLPDGRCVETIVPGPGSGGPVVVVVRGPTSPPLERWARELLVYAGSLARAAATPSRHLRNTRPDGRDGDLSVPSGMVLGESPALRSLLEQIRATVRSRLDVLLLGETGTGKELFARLVHASGLRPSGPLVAINCAAIPTELLEAELFGVHGRIATGVDPRAGRLLAADGGSIFLDEVGELPAPMQAKILRFLQEREVQPLGATAAKKIDVRVISASNRDLRVEVAAGRFRADLFYRLRGLQFHIPPLRERKDDIPGLVTAFVPRAAEEYGHEVRGVSRAALDLLLAHDWPGNVRELEAEVRRAVLLCPDGGVLQPEHFGPVRWAVDEGARPPAPRGARGQDVPIRPGAQRAGRQAGRPRAPRPGGDGAAKEQTSPMPGFQPGCEAPGARERMTLDDAEAAAIRRALERHGGNRTRAAVTLGISRGGLLAKLRRLGLREP